MHGSANQKPPRKKTPWQARLELIESLCLDRVAAEVNEKRLKTLLCRLAAPSAHESQSLKRLIMLHESGQLTELPTDQRASAVRMRRLLVGLHRVCGMHPSRVIDIPRLASCAGLSPATCERAVRDLAEGQLVIANRARARPARYGGQGPSSYQIVWSTITDLARSQGVQAFLFDRSQTGLIAGLPPPSAGAPPHSAGALPHCAGALPHKPRANARADVLSDFPYELPSSPSPSDSRPPDAASQAAASPHLAGRRTAESQKENFYGLERRDSQTGAGSPSDEGEQAWREAAARLQRYGIYFSRETVAKARRRGWTIEQVGDLLGACEAKRCGDLFAWPPGLVCRHLQLAPPGVPIAIPPAEAFVRARRDQDLALQQARASASAASPEEIGMTEREIDRVKMSALIAELTDQVLIREADQAGALIFPSTGKPLTAPQLRRNPPPELVKALRRRFADWLDTHAVAVVEGKLVVRERVNPDDLRRPPAPNLFPK